MAQKRKPDRVDVVIVGTGASGATAAKVLTERGMHVVALERGPWRKPESFGGDELANVITTIYGPTQSLTRAPYARRQAKKPKSTFSVRYHRWSVVVRCTGRAGCRALPRA
ncbi:MAG TPA: FAD-dependent monooxygenase, partial [Chthoniobacterales bacterium]|nr:FAD-dependent monooxygenase [Chthoniobacterales bacterium]